MITLKKCTSIASIISCAVLLTLSCKENSSLVTPSRQVVNYTFNGSEGGAITLATAENWIGNYANQNPTAVKSHFFGVSAINDILNSNNCVGIRIYYSIDDAGAKQLLLIGADGNGNDLSSVARVKGKTSSMNLGERVASESLSRVDGDLILENASKQWITNYQAKNPTSFYAHFFGFEILHQILNQAGCIGIRMYYALNSSGVQQILLVGVNSAGTNMLPTNQIAGKVSGADATIADMSFPCPTHCSGN